VLGAGRTGAIRSIVFACDAGMGSSAMGASVLRKKIRAAGHQDVTVTNKAISSLSDTYDLVVTHQDLTDRARLKTPSAIHVSVENFIGSPRYDEIVELLDRGPNGGAVAGTADQASVPVPRVGDEAPVLAASSVVLGGSASTRDEAIAEAGRLLVEAGAVDATYVDAMHERERSVSSYMGSGLAIPHGTNEAKGAIRRTAMSFVRYDQPVDWNGKPAEFVIGIAGAGDDHLALLARVAETFTDSARVERLRAARTADEVLAALEAAPAEPIA
jgi:PTS system mannitol-specific IIC component